MFGLWEWEWRKRAAGREGEHRERGCQIERWVRRAEKRDCPHTAAPSHNPPPPSLYTHGGTSERGMGLEKATRITAMQEGRKRGNPALFRPCYGHIDRPGGRVKRAAKDPQKGNFKRGDFSKGQFSGLSALRPLSLSSLKPFNFGPYLRMRLRREQSAFRHHS